MTKVDLIKEFLGKVEQEYGPVPKFCHGSNSKKEKVYYSGPHFDENEMVAAIEALLFSKWSSSGECCSKFEREFGKRINQKHSFFTNSGSSANLILIAACKEHFKWSDGDEVIVSAVGFPTTTSVLVQNSLRPVFVDIEWDTLNFDLEKLKEKITEKTKAVFLSPVLGNPPDMDKLLSICDAAGVKLILDNCDSLGSMWEGKFLNEYAVASSCSFYPAHEITTLEGGMVSSNLEEIVNLARSYATWGRDCWCSGSCNLLPNGSCGKRFSNWLKDFPEVVVDHKYVFNRIGYNLKPLDLQGAIGLAQLEKLGSICSARKSNQSTIEKLFLQKIKNCKGVSVLSKTEWVPFGVPIVCSSSTQKQKLVKYLESSGIQTRNYFAGNLLMHNGYRHLGDYKEYPESNKVLDLVFFIGCSPNLSQDNILHIEEALSSYEN